MHLRKAASRNRIWSPSIFRVNLRSFLVPIWLGVNLLLPLLGSEHPSTVVLERTIVQDGNTQITIDRVTPPPLPESPINQRPSEALSPPQASLPEPQFLAISATVYDHTFTELRLTHIGQNIVARSRLNFHLLEGTAAFTWHGRPYHLFLTIGDESIADSIANRATLIAQGIPAEVLPLPPQPPQGTAADRLGYELISDPATFSPAVLQALTDLHQFTLSHLPSLQQHLEQRIKLALQPAPAPPPPPPADVHIQFWPIHSNRYDTTPASPEDAP